MRRVRRVRAPWASDAVRVYVGQTRSRKLIAELLEFGFREITQRHEFPPRRTPWALDNGAFGDWRAKREFNAEQFSDALSKSAAYASRPDFVVVPDRVAAGMDSLELSLQWQKRCAEVGPAYLVVQDGMTTEAVTDALSMFDGVFVGGSLPWKIATGSQWVEVAHRCGKPCHIGRVGTPRRVAWAKRIGADSIDSCLPLWSRGHLQKFVEAVGGTQRQKTLDFGGQW